MVADCGTVQTLLLVSVCSHIPVWPAASKASIISGEL
jgi:hypothetical protein